MIRYVFIALLVLDFAYNILRYVLTSKQHKKPLPKSVSDIYDKKEYARWTEYQKAKQKLGLYSTVVSSAVMLVMFATDALAWMYSWFAVGEVGQNLLLVCTFTLITQIVSLPVSYIYQFKIEEKYGMNRCSIKTFIGDKIREYLINVVLCCALCGLYLLAYDLFEGNLILVMSVATAALIILLNLCIELFVKAQNKVTPLEEGSLKSKLQALFEKEGFSLKEIYVTDDSRRTTKANAYAMGIGKMKKIMLSDNLISDYTEDEIVACFAHELGHYKNHDGIKGMAMSVAMMLVYNLAICAILLVPQISMAFGFSGACAAFAMITVMGSTVLNPVNISLAAIRNAVGRVAERRADALAVDHGYGEALISFFRKAAQKYLANLNPHPVIIAIEDEHPPIYKRIEEIRARMKK